MDHQYPDQFLRNIQLLKKKEGGNSPCINLKALNKFIPYKHFKMESLHCLKYFLEKHDFGNKEKQRYIDKSICLLVTRFTYYPVRIIKPFYYI